MSVTLANSSGSAENLKVSRRCGARSWSAQTWATVMRLTLRCLASVRVDQWVMARSAGGPARVTATISARRASSIVRELPGAGLILKAVQAWRA
jgi:hypothetical protein